VFYQGAGHGCVHQAEGGRAAVEAYTEFKTALLPFNDMM